jgi:hypothetical protein
MPKIYFIYKFTVLVFRKRQLFSETFKLIISLLALDKICHYLFHLIWLQPGPKL